MGIIGLWGFASVLAVAIRPHASSPWVLDNRDASRMVRDFPLDSMMLLLNMRTGGRLDRRRRDEHSDRSGSRRFANISRLAITDALELKANSYRRLRVSPSVRPAIPFSSA